MQTDRLSSIFSALADPTRRAILVRLTDGEASVGELSEPFQMSQPAISRHLRVLENAGLIVRRVEGAKHPCRLAEKGLDDIDQWLEMLRTALSRNYDRLDKLLAEMKSPTESESPRRQTPVAGDPKSSPQRQGPVAGDPESEGENPQ